MTNKQFAKLAQNLVADLPGHAIQGQLMIAAPLEHMVRGLCFDSSFQQLARDPLNPDSLKPT